MKKAWLILMIFAIKFGFSQSYTWVKSIGKDTNTIGYGYFKTPTGVAFDKNGNMYVADAGNHRIQKFDVSGQHVLIWGTKGAANGQFNFPAAIAIDPNGNLYVADENNHRIQKFNANGKYLLPRSGNRHASPRG